MSQILGILSGVAQNPIAIIVALSLFAVIGIVIAVKVKGWMRDKAWKESLQNVEKLRRIIEERRRERQERQRQTDGRIEDWRKRDD